MKINWYLLLAVGVAMIIYHSWFFDYSILSYSDWGFYYDQTLKGFFAVPTLWRSTMLGIVDLGLFMYPINITWSVLSNFTNYGLSERIVYFFPSILIAVVGSYFLVKKLINNNLAAFIGSSAYTYNTYFLAIRNGHLTLMSAFAVAPFIMIAFINTLEQKKFYWAVVTGLLCGLCSIFEFRGFYIVAVVLLIYAIFQQIFIERSWKNNLFKNGILTITPIAITALLNFYWLLATAMTGSLTNNIIFNRGLFGEGFLNLLRAFTLSHPFWGDKPAEYFLVKSISPLSWLLPFIVLVILIFNNKNDKNLSEKKQSMHVQKLVLFFGCIAWIGLMLTKQAGLPFPKLYFWIYTHIPGFNAFREGSKFYFLIALGYSVIIGTVLGNVADVIRTKFKFRFAGQVLALIVIVVIFVNTRPIIDGEVGGLLTPRHIQKDYLTIQNFIQDQPDYFRTFWVPTDSRWSFTTNNHPKISGANLIDADWLSFVSDDRKENIQYTEAELLYDLLNKDTSANLLSVSSVKYVFVPIRDIANDDDFYVFYDKDRNFYIDFLSKLQYLKRINIGTSEVAVFENPTTKPHLYITPEIETYQKTVPYQSVEYSYINQSEYKVTLKNISKPIYLNFAEIYHGDWQIYFGDFIWWQNFIAKNTLLSAKNHFKNDALLNSFLIDPKVIIKDYPSSSYTLNSDGSINLAMTLYFNPQSYVYFGLIVSILTLTGSVAFLIYVFVKKRYEK